MFVIPEYGTLDKEQKLCTQKEEEAAVLLDNVRGLQQYVYRHEIYGYNPA